MESSKLEIVAVLFGVIAFTVTILAYLLNAKHTNINIFPGMVMLISGYTLLLIGEVIALRKHADHQNEQIQDTPVKQYGYALLAIFFGLIHIYPQLTFHVRYYDKFAAIGAFLLAISNLYYLTFIGVSFLLVYCILGTIPKFTETGLVNKLQLFSRALLVIHYGIILALL